MRINAVSINSALNRTQGPIKKISAITKPTTFAVEEVSDDLSSIEPAQVETQNRLKANNRLDMLGGEVDVWV